MDQLPNIMPDYMLCFAVVILTHIPTYETNKDVQVLEQLKNALWFVLEPLMVKNENFSLQFYKMLLEMMKSHVVASDPPSDLLNHVSYILKLGSGGEKNPYNSLNNELNCNSNIITYVVLENVGPLWPFAYDYHEQSNLVQWFQ